MGLVPLRLKGQTPSSTSPSGLRPEGSLGKLSWRCHFPPYTLVGTDNVLPHERDDILYISLPTTFPPQPQTKKEGDPGRENGCRVQYQPQYL
ncbi:hypothetical protein Pcinc_044114 [Petrolisthes cinctipes]|uniref:Uncharacterized protein n=1 Tax=Petrolisthes cinctipes TaxID=88211 RepID=A0AAE1BHR3_PETCI|nr:hypothetical protein Pcinc_044114 [Petrolisthes cinctipes]